MLKNESDITVIEFEHEDIVTILPNDDYFEDHHDDKEISTTSSSKTVENSNNIAVIGALCVAVVAIYAIYKFNKIKIHGKYKDAETDIEIIAELEGEK